MLQDTTDSESKSTIKVVQEVRSPLIPDDAHVTTVAHQPSTGRAWLPATSPSWRSGIRLHD